MIVKKKKANQSHYRPGVGQRVPGSSGSTGLEWPRGFQEVQVPQAWSGPEGSRKFRFHRPGVTHRVPGSSGSTGLEWPRGFQEVQVPKA